MDTSLSIPSSVPLSARWPTKPRSNQDCTCLAGPRIGDCNCFRSNNVNQTIFQVDYSSDNQTICWRNLTKEMNGTQFFLFIEEKVCSKSSLTERYLSGARVLINAATKGELNGFMQDLIFLLCFLFS